MQGTVHGIGKQVHINGLFQEIKGTQPECLDDNFLVSTTCYYNYLCIGEGLLYIWY